MLYGTNTCEVFSNACHIVCTWLQTEGGTDATDVNKGSVSDDSQFFLHNLLSKCEATQLFCNKARWVVWSTV